MGNVNMEASQINYRGGQKKMSVEEALKNTSGEAAAIAQLQTDVLNLNSNKANQITIAPFFNAETAYDPGDLVYYNGLIYRCVNAHEGEWDADNFAATTIAGELDLLKSGLTNTAKLLHINAPADKADVNGFLGYILTSIIENQSLGAYLLDGAWISHDYYTGVVYKVSSDTAIGMFEYGTIAQSMALYSACYKLGVYSEYKTVQYSS